MNDTHEAGAPAGAGADAGAEAPAHAHEATRAAVIAAGGSMTAAHDEHDSHDAGPALGPLDAQAWGAGILGIATGGLVAALLYLAAYH